MRGIALVIEAVNIILKHLGEQPESAEANDLRERGLAYINEAVLWKDAEPPPSVQAREALMKKVLGLHVAVTRLGCQQGPTKARVAYPQEITLDHG